MRVCMVGTGRMAIAHSRALEALPDVELHTVVNPDLARAAAFAKEQGYLATAPTVEAACASGGLDTVVICTPNPLHFGQSATALRAGMHVLCELPLAMSLDEVETLGGLADAADLRLMVCHTERYEAGRIELRRRVSAGELHPLQILARFHMLRRGHMATAQAQHSWPDNALWHHGCHVVDAIMDIVGPHEPLDLSAHFGPASPGLGTPLDVSLNWRAISPITGEEVLVTASLSHNAHWGHHDYLVLGREAALMSSRGELHNREGVIVERPSSSPSGVALQDAEFVEAVREGRAPALDVPTILPTIRIVQAAWDVWLKKNRD